MKTADLRRRADHAELQSALRQPPEAAVWAIRLLLHREPASDDEIRYLCSQPDIESLKIALLRLDEQEDINPQASEVLLSLDRQHWREMADSLHAATNSPTSLEAASWAIRLFLDREPKYFEEMRYHRQHPDLTTMRQAFLDSPEFQNRRLWKNSLGEYRLPLFMLQPPSDQRLSWEFMPPTMSNPVTQICTEAQFDEPDYLRLCDIHKTHATYHRKQWEFMYIHRVLEQAGMLAPEHKLLGFGTGLEPLPSIFASFGASVRATDAPASLNLHQGWSTTLQYSTKVDDLFMPKLVSREQFDRLVTFSEADMNAIPNDLRDYDACWSACAFEHLGSIEHGLRFYENSLETLRPGGIAVHTTELNLSSNDETHESEGLSLFRRQDIERLLSRLVDAGHEVATLNLHPGTGQGDRYIDTPPFSFPHIRLDAGKYVNTSIGIICRKRQ